MALTPAQAVALLAQLEQLRADFNSGIVLNAASLSVQLTALVLSPERDQCIVAYNRVADAFNQWTPEFRAALASVKAQIPPPIDPPSPPDQTGFQPHPLLVNIPVNTALDLGAYTCVPIAGMSAACRRRHDYSGMVYDKLTHVVRCFGGGHAAPFLDDVESVDFTKPILQWESEYPPTSCAEMNQPGNYDESKGSWISTGHPLSRHSYGGIVMAEHELIMVIPLAQGGTGGCATGSPAITSDLKPGKIQHYDTNTKLWSQGADATLWHSWVEACYDPQSKNIIIIGDGWNLGQAKMWAYHVPTRVLTTLRNSPIPRGGTNNLIYFPPNGKMYYMKTNSTLGDQVWEVTLDRANLTQSTAVKLETTGDIPSSYETGWAYDSVNQIIGGGVKPDTFYAFSPLHRKWTKKAILSQSVWQTVGWCTYHMLAYDPVDNVFVFVANAPTPHTWAYRYGLAPEPPPIEPPDPTPDTNPIPPPGPQQYIAASALHVDPSTTYNSMCQVAWKNRSGDYSDKNGVAQGPDAWATATVMGNNTVQVIEFDVTLLLIALQNGMPNRGFIISRQSGTTIAVFNTSRAADPAVGPRLEVVAGANAYTLTPGADQALPTSTGIPQSTSLRMSIEPAVALWFDTSVVVGQIDSAKLILVTDWRQYGSGSAVLALNPVDIEWRFAPIPIEYGIAAMYENDDDIEHDPETLFVENFSDPNLAGRGWNGATGKIIGDTDPDDANYQPLAPAIKSYKMVIPAGEQISTGGSARYLFYSNFGYEPEDVYIRAYARLGTDFDSGGGKFPFGFDCTYNPITGDNLSSGRPWTRIDAPAFAGNGQNRSLGNNGYSMRGAFYTYPGDPLHTAGYRFLGSYVYHADQTENAGDSFAWDRGLLYLVQKNIWYCIEQRLKLNSVLPDGTGVNDGIMQVWVGGRLAMDQRSMRFRNWPGNPAGALNIKTYALWLNFFHGGLEAAKTPLACYLSKIVIAKQYIGPA